MASYLNQIIERDTLLVFETGEYSDFTYHGPVRVIKTFKKSDVVDEFLKDWPVDDTCREEPYPEDFLPWLIKKGYVCDEPSVQWHIGSYSDFDP